VAEIQPPVEEAQPSLHSGRKTKDPTHKNGAEMAAEAGEVEIETLPETALLAPPAEAAIYVAEKPSEEAAPARKPRKPRAAKRPENGTHPDASAAEETSGEATNDSPHSDAA
jgi:hypothetical protein